MGSVPLPNIEALARLLIVDEPVGDDLPWPAIEQAWGVVFPNDYKQFLGLCGAGTFGAYLGVMAPFPQDHKAYKAGHRMVPLDREMLEELCCPFPAYPEEGGVIAIGATPNGDTLLYRIAPSPWTGGSSPGPGTASPPRTAGPNTSSASSTSRSRSCRPSWKRTPSAGEICGAPSTSPSHDGTKRRTDRARPADQALPGC